MDDDDRARALIRALMRREQFRDELRTEPVCWLGWDMGQPPLYDHPGFDWFVETMTVDSCGACVSCVAAEIRAMGMGDK